MFRSYVEAVLAGREMADSSVGRALHDLVQSVPKMDTDEFEKMLNSNMRVSYLTNDYMALNIYDIMMFQDLLMVIYLSQLTKTQLQLNEKLSMVSVNNIREVAKLLPAD